MHTEAERTGEFFKFASSRLFQCFINMHDDECSNLLKSRLGHYPLSSKAVSTLFNVFHKSELDLSLSFTNINHLDISANKFPVTIFRLRNLTKFSIRIGSLAKSTLNLSRR